MSVVRLGTDLGYSLSLSPSGPEPRLHPRGSHPYGLKTSLPLNVYFGPPSVATRGVGDGGVAGREGERQKSSRRVGLMVGSERTGDEVQTS